MKVKRILSSLLALPRLEQLAEQAHKAVRHRDEATLSALKAEIDECIATLIPVAPVVMLLEPDRRLVAETRGRWIMRVFKGIGLGILLLVGLLAPVDRALAQQGTGSVLTNAIQSGRMTVLEVNAATGQIHCVEADGRLRVVEFPNGVPMVVSNGVRRADLGLLSAGDLIKVERPTDGQAYTIVVLRRGSDEIASPEH